MCLTVILPDAYSDKQSVITHGSRRLQRKQFSHSPLMTFQSTCAILTTVCPFLPYGIIRKKEGLNPEKQERQECRPDSQREKWEE